MSKTALFKAAKLWQKKTVAGLPAANPDLVEARDARGRTALQLCAAQPVHKAWAPARASVTTARALIAEGADIRAGMQRI